MSSANQKIEKGSWLTCDKQYKGEKCGEATSAFGLHVIDSRSLMEWMECHAPAGMPWSVEICRLVIRYLRMSQGQTVVWYPSPRPTCLHSALPDLGQSPQTVKGRGGLALQLGLESLICKGMMGREQVG